MLGTGIGRRLVIHTRFEGSGRAPLITTESTSNNHLMQATPMHAMSIVNKTGNDVGTASCADVNCNDLIGSAL